MQVAELWRYPVKSMAGEPLESAELRSEGIAGDRDLQVQDPHGRVVTSRSRPVLLAHRGTLDPQGETRVDGRPWDSSEVRRDIEAAVGPGARLVRSRGRERFDILPLLVATDGAIAAFGHDRRRLRPNIVIGSVPGLAERNWEGRRLRIGKTLIGIEELRERCIMTTFDPDTQVQDLEVLKGIRRDFGGRLALNAWVIEPGTIAVGDPVELL